MQLWTLAWRLPMCRLFPAALLTVTLTTPLNAVEPDAKSADFFEKKIRPLLVERCVDCHSGGAPESGLGVDSLAGLVRGGSRGPAIVIGKPEESLLVRAIRHGELLKMPAKEKLPAAQIADVVRWIEAGAAWPNEKPPEVTLPTAGGGEPVWSDEQKAFWSFQRPVAAPLPQVVNREWVQSPIDAFVLSQLEAASLSPAPRADKRTLIRRATFDLIGLPPTPQEVEAFLADDSPGAFARVVERLLASPRYGERWGRHWLDVARYADSNGLDENLAYANAFRYRDYVVAAFNRDLPFDQFVREQIAGDLLPDSPGASDRFDRITATGFLSLGAKMLAEDDPVKMQMDIIDEQIDTVGRAFMGLTLGCARCHDHKFDPISAHDYYALAGIFKSTRTMATFSVVARWQEVPLATAEAQREREEQRKRIEAAKGAVAELVKKHTPGDEKIRSGGETASDLESRFPAEVREELGRLRAEIAELEKSLPEFPAAMAVADENPQDVPVHIRGSHLTLGAVVERRMPRVLVRGEQPAISEQSSGRRELAEWLTSPGHPLTARVMANRIWLWHFGEGLVRSPDNFGRLGDRPTHPALLDWLAVRFVESGWSIKQMHRLILLSSTWQQSSTADPATLRADPENRLLGRMNRRRLDAEAIRDSLLAVAGSLDGEMGGTLLPTKNRAYVTSTANVDPVVYVSNRRSIYLPVVRSALYDVFQAFDFADPSVLNGQRQTTTVAPQALFMMNSQLVAEQSRRMAERLLAEEPPDAAARVTRAWHLAYSRPPTDDEIASALQYVERYAEKYRQTFPDRGDAELRSWQSLCRAVMGANEFLFVE